jgi:mannan polymerase II complex ANP1 subunit
MEREKLAAEEAEKEKAEKAMKLKESFGDPTGQWEKDKSELQNIAPEEKKETSAEAAAGTKDKADAKGAAGKAQDKAEDKTGDKVIAGKDGVGDGKT